MKKYILVIALFLLAINYTQAQYRNPFIPNHCKNAKQNLFNTKFSNQLNPISQTKHNLKATKATIWNVDTVVVYDTANNQDYRIVQNFNNNGDLLTSLFELWQNNVWINSGKSTCIYDAYGNLLTEISEEWVNNAWVNSWKSSYIYNANGNILNRLFQEWQNNVWLNYEKYIYSYDVNGNNLTELSEYWLNNVWVNNRRFTYTYDANGNRLIALSEYWLNNVWVYSWRSTYTYDVNGKIITLFSENWQNNAWINSGKSTYTYNANGNLLTEIYETWLTDAWENSWRYTYTFDANGNQLTELSESWQYNIWITEGRYTYTYDVNGNSITGKGEMWENSNWALSSSGLLLIYSSKNIISVVFGSCYIAHFISFSSAIDEKDNDSQIIIYPNPASDKLIIDFQSINDLKNIAVSFYNIQGKLLLQQAIKQPLIEINISSFAKGVYIVKVINEKEVTMQKLIKQ
jgi:hypothetical protein